MDLLCFCSVLCLLCLFARLFICAFWSPVGKGLTSWLSFVASAVCLSLSHWYPGSGVVLDYRFLIFAPLLTFINLTILTCSNSYTLRPKTNTFDHNGLIALRCLPMC